MLRRLRRPGYWIVLLALLTVYFYQQYQKREAEQRREARFRLYQSYGASILGELGEGNLTKIHKRLLSAGEGEIALEDIAMFVSTLHLERSPRARWKAWEENEENVTLHGELVLDENGSYPMDMMIVKKGDKVLLHRLRVGPKILELKKEGFPFNTESENNTSIVTDNPDRNVTF